MGTFYLAPAANFFSTTLNGSINSSQTTGITLTSVTNLLAPGYLILDREDGSGNQTANAREVISFTGISGSELTGVTRGADSSTARAHNDGALVESTPTVGAFNSLATISSTAFTGDGYLRAIASPVSLARIDSSQIYASLASLSVTHITQRLSVSGASVTGLPLYPIFHLKGNFSGPTVNPFGPVRLPRVGTWDWFSVVTRTVASGASAILDVNVNGTSIFDAGTRPSIAGGGTFVSTASIATKNFAQGAVLTVDYDTTGGHVTDLTIQGGTT